MPEPRYRIERRATDAELWQWFINCLRRLSSFFQSRKRANRGNRKSWQTRAKPMRVDLVIIIAAPVAWAVLAHTTVSWL
jgi:hypothetical protein